MPYRCRSRLAGVLEPVSQTPVIIEDDVLVGANAVVLGEYKGRERCVVAAGAVVVSDVPAYTIAAGVPAKL